MNFQTFLVTLGADVRTRISAKDEVSSRMQQYSTVRFSPNEMPVTLAMPGYRCTTSILFLERNKKERKKGAASLSNFNKFLHFFAWVSPS